MSEIECRKWRYRIENPPSLMHIPEPLLKCVGFLADEMPDASGIEYDPFATGFFVVIPSSQSAGGFLCFVTAKHNFYDGQGGIKTPTILLNRKDGGVMTFKDYDNKAWLHPTDKSADVAVIPFNRNTEMDIVPIPLDLFIRRDELEKKKIFVGDEVYSLGLFTIAPGKQRNMPLARYGNIAMLPDEPIQVDEGFADVYLVEARSIGGMSGSPVFVRETVAGHGRRDHPEHGEPGEIHGLGKTYLLGLMHGHWDIKESDLNKTHFMLDREHGVNMGIGVVVPADKIIETINRPELKSRRDEHEENMRKSRIPTADRARKKPKEYSHSLTRADFEAALKKASRKIPAK